MLAVGRLPQKRGLRLLILGFNPMLTRFSASITFSVYGSLPYAFQSATACLGDYWWLGVVMAEGDTAF